MDRFKGIYGRSYLSGWRKFLDARKKRKQLTRAETALRELITEIGTKCVWTPVKPYEAECFSYHTSCGCGYVMGMRPLEDGEMPYCYNCGRKVELIPPDKKLYSEALERLTGLKKDEESEGN